MRPEPGKGSDIFRVPRGRGLLRRLLSIMTRATMPTAAAAQLTTIPAFAPVDRPGAAGAVEESDEDELSEAEEDEVPSLVDDAPAAVAVPVESDVSLAAVAVDYGLFVSHYTSTSRNGIHLHRSWRRSRWKRSPPKR